MNAPKPTGEPQVRLAQLVEALNKMRDTLVEVSLALQDFKFSFDAEGRTQAEEKSEALLKKLKPSDPE